MLRPKNSKAYFGQSLVEYVLMFPVMLLVLVGTFGVGMAMYQAHMASDAIRQPALQKLEMAASDYAICDRDLLGYINGSKLGGNLKMGPYLDSVAIREQNDYGSVLVGRKTITPIAPFLPTFDVKVTQVVNRNLLYPAYMGESAIRVTAAGRSAGGSVGANPVSGCQPSQASGVMMNTLESPGPSQPLVTIRLADVPWVPYGTPNVPPWEGGGGNGNRNGNNNNGGLGGRFGGGGNGGFGSGGNLNQGPPTQTSGTMGNGGNNGQNW